MRYPVLSDSEENVLEYERPLQLRTPMYEYIDNVCGMIWIEKFVLVQK